MNLNKAFTVFGILALLTLINLLVVTNPGMAEKSVTAKRNKLR